MRKVHIVSIETYYEYEDENGIHLYLFPRKLILRVFSKRYLAELYAFGVLKTPKRLNEIRWLMGTVGIKYRYVNGKMVPSDKIHINSIHSVVSTMDVEDDNRSIIFYDKTKYFEEDEIIYQK